MTCCAVLVVINPSGPLHSVITVTGTFTSGLSSTVQVRVMEDPTIGTTGGVTVTLVGAGTINVKPGNKNQMLGTHIDFEISMVKFMFFIDTH